MNYGFTADEAIDRMNMLGDISQGNAEKMTRIATAYGQMSSAGKVQLEDIKQMIEAGFNPLQEISQTTGESMESLYDRISKGTISVDEITDSMIRSTSEGGKYFQSMEKQSKTLNGMLSTLKDTVNMKLGEAFQGLSDKISEALPKVIEFIEKLDVNQVINGIVILVTSLGTLIGIITTLRGAISALNILNQVKNIGGIGAIVSNLTANLAGMGAMVAPVLAVVAGIIALVAILTHAYATNEEFRNSVNELISALGDFFKPILDTIIDTFKNMLPTITSIIDLIVQIAIVVANVATKVIQIITPIISTVVGVISSAISKIVDVIGTITNVFSSVFNGIVGIISPIMNTVSSLVVGTFNAIQSAWNGLTGFVSGVFNGIYGAVQQLVSSVKGFVNGVIGGINGAIGIINMIPGVEISEIPYLAKGGVLKRGQVGLLEGSGAEAVVPLEKNKQWIRAVAKDMVQIMPSVGASGGQTINFYQPIQTADQVARVLRLERRHGLAGAR